MIPRHLHPFLSFHLKNHASLVRHFRRIIPMEANLQNELPYFIGVCCFEDMPESPWLEGARPLQLGVVDVSFLDYLQYDAILGQQLDSSSFTEVKQFPVHQHVPLCRKRAIIGNPSACTTAARGEGGKGVIVCSSARATANKRRLLGAHKGLV